MTEQPSPHKSNSRSRTVTIVVVAVVVIVIIGVVAAYVITQNHPNNKTTAPAKVTITVWGSGSAGGESQAFNQTLASFEAAYPNVTVVDSPAVNVASTTYLSAAHAGKAPDVYRDTSDNGGALYTAGTLLNLSKYLNSTYESQFLPTTIKDFMINGALYGIPVNENGVGLYYNKQLVPVPPQTFNQFLSDAKNNTDIASNGSIVSLGIAYGLGNDYGYRFAAWFPAFGGELFNSTFYPMFNTPADIAAMSFVYNWTAVYKIDTVGLTFTDEQNLFETGKSAFMIDGPWDQSVYQKALGSNVGVAPLPFNTQTGLWAEPFLGSVGYVISDSAASGINASQIWASLQFVKYMTNYNAQLKLFNLAGDFPSLNSVGAYVSNNSGSDPLVSGWLAQYSHTQVFPNFPQMAYYWTPFHIAATNLISNSSKGVTPGSVMAQLQSTVLTDIQQAGLSPSAPAVSSPTYNLMLEINEFTGWIQTFSRT